MHTEFSCKGPKLSSMESEQDLQIAWPQPSDWILQLSFFILPKRSLFRVGVFWVLGEPMNFYIFWFFPIELQRFFDCGPSSWQHVPGFDSKSAEAVEKFPIQRHPLSQILWLTQSVCHFTGLSNSPSIRIRNGKNRSACSIELSVLKIKWNKKNEW